MSGRKYSGGSLLDSRCRNCPATWRLPLAGDVLITARFKESFVAGTRYALGKS